MGGCSPNTHINTTSSERATHIIRGFHDAAPLPKANETNRNSKCADTILVRCLWLGLEAQAMWHVG